ncbi:hypothetical protein Tco_1500113 [Tanacetum coccineum]
MSIEEMRHEQLMVDDEIYGYSIEIRKKERILMEEKSLAVSRQPLSNPSEFEAIFDDTCDEPVCDDSSTFDALNDNSEILSNSNDDDTSSDDDDFEDIKYVSWNR